MAQPSNKTLLPEWFADKESLEAFQYGIDKVNQIAKVISANSNYIATIYGEVIENPSATVTINGKSSLILISGNIIAGDCICAETGTIITSKKEIDEAISLFEFYKKTNLSEIIEKGKS